MLSNVWFSPAKPSLINRFRVPFEIRIVVGASSSSLW